MNHNKAYWQSVAERYFSCTATEEEERQLMAFVAANDDPAFDDVRAVMGYTATARHIAATPNNHSRRRLVAAAAAILIVAGTAMVYRLNGPDCVAYVHGERVTDRQSVMTLMQHTVSLTAHHATAENTMESQLTDMFGTISEDATNN